MIFQLDSIRTAENRYKSWSKRGGIKRMKRLLEKVTLYVLALIKFLPLLYLVIIGPYLQDLGKMQIIYGVLAFFGLEFITRYLSKLATFISKPSDAKTEPLRNKIIGEIICIIISAIVIIVVRDMFIPTRNLPYDVVLVLVTYLLCSDETRMFLKKDYHIVETGNE